MSDYLAEHSHVLAYDPPMNLWGCTVFGCTFQVADESMPTTLVIETPWR